MAESWEWQETTEGRLFGGLRYHPRAADASLERLRQLAGILQLADPVPFTRFLDCEADDDMLI